MSDHNHNDVATLEPCGGITHEKKTDSSDSADKSQRTCNHTNSEAESTASHVERSAAESENIRKPSNVSATALTLQNKEPFNDTSDPTDNKISECNDKISLPEMALDSLSNENSRESARVLPQLRDELKNVLPDISVTIPFIDEHLEDDENTVSDSSHQRSEGKYLGLDEFNIHVSSNPASPLVKGNNPAFNTGVTNSNLLHDVDLKLSMLNSVPQDPSSSVFSASKTPPTKDGSCLIDIPDPEASPPSPEELSDAQAAVSQTVDWDTLHKDDIAANSSNSKHASENSKHSKNNHNKHDKTSKNHHKNEKNNRNHFRRRSSQQSSNEDEKESESKHPDDLDTNNHSTQNHHHHSIKKLLFHTGKELKDEDDTSTDKAAKVSVRRRKVRFSTSEGCSSNSDSDTDEESAAPLMGNGTPGDGLSHGDKLRASFSRNRNAPSNTIITTSSEEIMKAYLYVKDCLSGREVAFKSDWWSMNAYKLYNQAFLSYFVVICAWSLIFLTMCEDPALPAVALPYYVSIPLEGFLILIIILRHLHYYLILEACGFWKKKETIFLLVTISLTLIDILCYVLWVNLASPEAASYAFRWSRPLRPVYLVLLPEEYRLRRALGNIWKTLPDISHVLVLWLSSIGLFALMAFKLLKDRNLVYSNEAPYFNEYWDTYWDLYVLVTTANNPDVMMPAYDYSTWFALFFVAFEIVNLYIFLNIVLAVVYNNYKEHLKSEVKSSVFSQRRCLNKAFEVLRVYENREWSIPWQNWQSLMKKLYPNMDHQKINFLLYVLDQNDNDMLEKKEFLQLKDLLGFELVDVVENPSLLQQHCRFYDSRVSQTIRTIILHRFFSITFDVLTIVNAICIAYDVNYAEWGFLSLFTFEIISKIYALGIKKYIKSKFNIFDFTIIMSAWVVSIFQNMFPSSEAQQAVLDFLLILRIVRVIRIGKSFDRFEIVLTTISKIIPFILTYGRVLFLLYYVYAIVGMELFKGRITYHGYYNLTNETNFCGNPLLNGTEFFIKRYCKNNFNNIIYAFVVLFDLMIVNQWHDFCGAQISNGFIVVTNKFSRLYFISFHIICVVVMLNIFAAFIIEIFFLEYQLKKDKVESILEERITDIQSGSAVSQIGRMLMTLDSVGEGEEEGSEASTPATSQGSNALQLEGLRFKVQKKSNARVESVLQQMFESEIDPGDDGSTMGDEPEHAPRRLTLSMLM